MQDLLRRVVLAIFFSGFFLHVQAGSPPDIPKGVTWLQAQVQGDGTLSGEAASAAAQFQVRSEAALTLKLLATAPSSLTGLIVTDTPGNTELLARQIIALKNMGQSVDSLVAGLLVRQNADGGFGGESGFTSNPLDTAWTLLALVHSNQMSSVAAALARSYLVASIQADGGMAGMTDADRIQNSALAILGLQASQADLSIATNVRNLATWLLQHQGVDGGWLGDLYLSSAICAALAPAVSDTAFRTNAAGFVADKQDSDGSWAKDPFLSAVALRALALLSAPTSPVAGTLSGQILDAKTGTALAGIGVTITGPIGQTQPSASDGRFAFTNLSAGTYGLQISNPGYQAFSASYTLLAGQFITAGAIALQPLSSSGTVRGHIVDGEGSAPLAGVTVALSTGLSTQTDAAGNFNLSGIPAGAVTLTASLAGYQNVISTTPANAISSIPRRPTLHCRRVHKVFRLSRPLH